jgi:hypothetical protein
VSEPKFSTQLEQWLKSDQPKTIESLEKVFQERSFAILILLLMFLPSLPLPTGGLTHIFEIVAMLIALQMIIGRKVLWLPSAWRKYKLGKRTTTKALPFIVHRIRWFERFTRPRLRNFVQSVNFLRLAGLIIFALTLTAFLSPPFSGLDTLPSLGVVVIALSIILGDALIFLIGTGIGLAGLVLIIGLGAAVTAFFRRVF